MARKNKPNHGTLDQSRGRYYYKVKLPGTSKRKTYPLVPAGRDSSTTDKRLAIALANEMYEREKARAELDGCDVEYDGTLPSLREVFIKDHAKEITAKTEEVQKKELRFYRTAINDLITFLESIQFSVVTFELKPNRIELWRKHLNTDRKVCRNTINKKVNVIKQMVHYAAVRELEPAQLMYNIDTIKPIKKGQGNFIDRPAIGPADWETVEKLMPYLDDMVRDMLLIMKHTGARPGEVRLIRPCDIDKSDPQAWVFCPERHKTQHHGKKRKIILNTDVQLILAKYLLRDPAMYCFPPSKKNNKNQGLHYTTGSFAKVIARAVTSYNNDHPDSPIQFHANQLRHMKATQVCLEHGLEVTRCLLGHATTQMTKRYARTSVEVEELNRAKEAVKKIG